MAGMELSRYTGFPFILVVRFSNSLRYHVFDERNNYSIALGGRSPRNVRDSADIEPIIHIPVELFENVPEV